MVWCLVVVVSQVVGLLGILDVGYCFSVVISVFWVSFLVSFMLCSRCVSLVMILVDLMCYIVLMVWWMVSVLGVELVMMVLFIVVYCCLVVSFVCRWFLCLWVLGVNFVLKFFVLNMCWIFSCMLLLVFSVGQCLIYFSVFFFDLICNMVQLVISFFVLVNGLLIMVGLLCLNFMCVLCELGCSFLLFSSMFVLVKFFMYLFMVVSSFLFGMMVVLVFLLVRCRIMNCMVFFFQFDWVGGDV